MVAPLRGSMVFHRHVRDTWDKHLEFMLSMIGYCVGFGNVWRFPYRAYRNGGGAFLLPYVLLMIFVGKPLFLLESCLGQFTSRGPIAAFNIIPVCRGIGLGMVIISFYWAIYYVMFMVYCSKFMYYSFTLPWKECNKEWGADDICYNRKDGADGIVKKANGSLICSKSITSNCTKLTTASEQFWKRFMLHQDVDSRIDNLGPLHVDLYLLLLLNWIILYLCLIRGIKSSGKVVYFSAIFPYVVLLIMAVYGFTLNGAGDGLYYLFVPEFSQVLKFEVWKEAVIQMFFSLSMGLGGIEVYCSYNDFQNKIHRDVFIITWMDFFTSFLASLSVFTTLGFLSNELNIPISTVAEKGPGLMFVVIPEALGLLPGAEVWSLMFFLMVYTLGVDTEFAVLETILTTLKDEFPVVGKHTSLTAAVACLVCFFLGLPFCTSGGFLVVDFYDSYGINLGLLWCSFFSCIAIMYYYGFRRFSDDLHFMLGFHPQWWYWQLCWVVIDPILLGGLLIVMFVDFENVDANGREFPSWFSSIKWIFSLIPILALPAMVVYSIFEYQNKPGGIKAAFEVNPEWGPVDPLTRALYKDWKKQKSQHREQKEKTFFQKLTERFSKKLSHSPDEPEE